mgnify:CR=1 FL=1
MDVMDLLDSKGLAPLVELAPLVGITMWILITVLLWKNGFDDLFERFTRPRWTLSQRLATLAMIPGRAVMLMFSAGLGAAVTTLGILINIGVVMNLVRAGKTLLAG